MKFLLFGIAFSVIIGSIYALANETDVNRAITPKKSIQIPTSVSPLKAKVTSAKTAEYNLAPNNLPYTPPQGKYKRPEPQKFVYKGKSYENYQQFVGTDEWKVMKAEGEWKRSKDASDKLMAEQRHKQSLEFANAWEKKTYPEKQRYIQTQKTRAVMGEHYYKKHILQLPEYQTHDPLQKHLLKQKGYVVDEPVTKLPPAPKADIKSQYSEPVTKLPDNDDGPTTRLTED